MIRRIDDWRTVNGTSVEIRKQEMVVCKGIVDAVTDDGNILWVCSPTDGRHLHEKAEFYEVWATDESPGFHYRVSHGQARG